ncbi:MAG: UDP-glucose 4-epimerase GalE [Desulfatitalea sp.]|nr:UDP-glucose 4-epimerase GalE [Desulfatitalea sp.]
MNILVAGGAGYIGSHVVKMLHDGGHGVTVLDDLSTGFRRLTPWGTFVQGSTGDADLLDRILGATRFDAIMHFAAFSQVGESVVKPLAYYRNNVAATLVLIQAAIRHQVRHFIFSSTAAVYGEPVRVPIAETHPCAPTSPYGATKLTVERMLHDCAAAHEFQYGCLRYFNAAGADPSGMIGELHDPETHIIPLLLNVAAGVAEQFTVYGTDYPTADGTCIRDYIHVNDLAAAHVLVLIALMAHPGNRTYNLGNSKGYSVKEVIAETRRVTGRTIPVTERQRRAGDPAVLVADSGKIRSELGWQPQYETLNAIIETAWRWHLKSHSGQ